MGFGIAAAFGSAIKLFVELNFILDVAICFRNLVGIALSMSVLFTNFLYHWQYFEKLPSLSYRRRKKHQ